MSENRFQPEAAEPKGNASSWMITFADVLALLLTFFVMLYAMNDIREDEWQGLVAAMAGRFNPANPPSDFRVQSGISDTSVHEMEGIDLGYLRTLIEAQLESSDTAGDYIVEEKMDGLHIHLPEVILIQQGRLILTPTAYAAARELGQVLRTVGNDVSVHGDASRGAEGAMYASAWEVSLASAMMVADTIREAGYERNILALGHGDAYLEEQSGMVNDAELSSGLSWGQVDIVIRDVESHGENGGT
jgi:chemotaxis protein MotB